MTSKLPTYFISHGGGPWPFMPEAAAMYANLAASLAAMPAQLNQIPKAILMISAHWEEPQLTLMSNPKPGMIYDYYGFPAHTYQVIYPAAGSPELAQQAQQLLQQAGFGAQLDEKRGFDHGVYSAIYSAYPKAEMPIVQLSLQAGLDPQKHIEIGRALAPLREQGILIIGSGLSYHNLRLLGAGGLAPSAEFDAWLQSTMALDDASKRTAQLINWSAAPAARIAHPREEHLLPLMVALGAGEDEKATCVYHEKTFMGGISVSSFRFG